MRVIAGELKGRKLKSVPGLHTRPTADKVKGAIFNVLRDKVGGARVLDLFSGTGSLAIEALSRGAAAAVLVEKNREAQQVIQENLQNISKKETACLVCADAFAYLTKLEEREFDLIFLDPPYHHDLVPKALSALGTPCRLSEGGVIVAEIGKDEEFTAGYPFELRKTSQYGDTRIGYFQRADRERDIKEEG